MNKKSFGIKCVLEWKKTNGTMLGLEERVYLVNATCAGKAFLAVEKILDNESVLSMKDDWKIQRVNDIMESYEMSDSLSVNGPVEIYSSLHKNRRSKKAILPYWFTSYASKE